MKLVINNFPVHEMRFGEQDSYENGVLTINKEKALDVVRGVKDIVDPDLEIVNPGDMVRLCPVKEVIEPRSRADGRCIFPGVTGDTTYCGEGELNALKNCCVTVVGKHWGGFQDGVIDMGGEGAKYVYFSQLINLVLVSDTAEEFEKHEQQKKNHALRWAGMLLAEHVGNIVKGLTAPEKEEYEFEPVSKRSPEVQALPSVVLVMQFQSQMENPGYNDLYYGWDTNRMVPTFTSPTEILDGAVISGSFMPCSSKWSTYDIQNAPIIKELMQEHGKTLNFLGVITSNLNVALEQKERSGVIVANMAKNLGADSAIVAEEGYGNPDADFIICLVDLEDQGIKTIGLTNECTGRDGASQPLVSLDEKANAIVSCGNVSELIELPPMRVIGELAALGRDGLSGGWGGDEVLGPSVRPDGSIIMENNSMFCGDQVLGWSIKTMKDF